MNYVPAFHLCEDLRPLVTESADQVVVELVEATGDRDVEDWAQCQNVHDASWGTIELTDPLDERTLVDPVIGDALEVIDGGRLLFPSALPAPFDLARWGEIANTDDGSWTLAWTAGPRRLPAGARAGPVLQLRVTRWELDATRPTGCTEQPIDLRGVTGNLCDAQAGSQLLSWMEGGGFFVLEVVDIAGEPLPEDIDLVAIAEGLEPLGS